MGLASRRFSRLFKNAHLLRSLILRSVRRTNKYASLLRISEALHLDIFKQPAKPDFFNKLLLGRPSMNRKRVYRTFIHKKAVFRICCEAFTVVTREIVRQRAILEDYILRDLKFRHTLEPHEVLADAPEVAKRMARAAKIVGVGPMAAVAGAMAQLAVEAALEAGAEEAIVDNGGDIYLKTTEPVVIALFAGDSGKIGRLAFSLQASDTPLSICSSSGKMGHSLSLGLCDLATVVAKDAALADAAATRAANLVRTVADVEKALETMAAVAGVSGLLIVKDGHVGLAGRVPPLVRMGQ